MHTWLKKASWCQLCWETVILNCWETVILKLLLCDNLCESLVDFTVTNSLHCYCWKLSSCETPLDSNVFAWHFFFDFILLQTTQKIMSSLWSTLSAQCASHLNLAMWLSVALFSTSPSLTVLVRCWLTTLSTVTVATRFIWPAWCQSFCWVSYRRVCMLIRMTWRWEKR